MASGRLGAVKPSAATSKTLYKPSIGVTAVVNVTFCNQSTSADAIRIAIVQASGSDPVPAAAEICVAYDSLVAAKGDNGLKDRGMFGPYELNGNNNDQIVVYSTGGNIAFGCTGDEGAV